MNLIFKHPLCILILCLLGGVRTAEAGYLVPGEALQDGQLVHAADLNNLVGNATLTGGFISTQPINNTPQLSDYVIEFSPNLNGLYKITLANFYNNPLAYTTLGSGVPNIYTNDLFAFYSAANNSIESITFTNLLPDISSNLPVEMLNFAPTNNNSGATNLFALSDWLTWTPFGTNNILNLLGWGTNGVPVQIPITNLTANIQTTVETNSLGWDYSQVFYPWKIYGTNTVAGYTNYFGYTTNFPITSILLTNITITTTNVTLTDTDTVPVNSYAQGVPGSGAPTNTTMTLYALYEYMTNKNALPPYTLARTQFSGITAIGECQGVTTITNMSNTTGIITNVALALNWTNPTPVSFQGAATMMPTTPGIVSNVVYWAQVTNGTPLPGGVPPFQLFTNFSTAIARVNPILGNGVNPVNGSTLWYVTNYTAVNCVVIQGAVTTGSATGGSEGLYSLWFTNIQPQNTLYYVTGIAQGTAGDIDPVVALSYLYSPTTNNVSILTSKAGTAVDQLPLVHVLCQPQ